MIASQFIAIILCAPSHTVAKFVPPILPMNKRYINRTLKRRLVAVGAEALLLQMLKRDNHKQIILQTEQS